VVVYNRASDGTLSPAGSVPTGGLGAGVGLGSQGAIVRSADGQWLFVVNAGSDQVSALRLNGNTPTLVATVSSGGDRPVSVTEYRGVVYVLNAGENNRIAGFRLVATPGPSYTLAPIAGSVRPLSAPNAGGAQVQFTPAGDALIVTEKMTNRILSYPVDATGAAGAPVITPSAGQTPFGFTYAGVNHDVLVVSEAFGGAPNASAASSYRVGPAGALTLVSASVPTHQTAACWFVPSKDGRFAFTTNTGSNSISGYQVEVSGALRLLTPSGVTATTGATPIDEAVSDGGAFLYALDSGSHAISAYAVTGGSLAPVQTLPGIPATAVGLAAR
jgi:6-phosphogluconolactonase (cycloisomerase 2 family)